MLLYHCLRWAGFLGKPSRRVPRRAEHPAAGRFRPRLEPLEARRVLACTSTDPFICAPLPPTHEGLALHFHPHLRIVVNGQEQVIPANIGITLNAAGQPTAFLPLHT